MCQGRDRRRDEHESVDTLLQPRRPRRHLIPRPATNAPVCESAQQVAQGGLKFAANLCSAGTASNAKSLVALIADSDSAHAKTLHLKRTRTRTSDS